MARKQHDDYFYWACVIFSEDMHYSLNKIKEILKSKGYSCGKSTVSDVITRYRNGGCPYPLKRGHPRESGAGKCQFNTPVKFTDEGIHSLAQNMTYKTVGERSGKSISTVYRIVKNTHYHDYSDDELRGNIDQILDEAEENESILSCKLIQNMLRLNFSIAISAYKLYKELNECASLMAPQLSHFNNRTFIE